MLALSASAAAGAGGDPFAPLAAANFDAVAQGVEALAVSGNPRAAAVIEALRDGKLFAWRWPRPDAPLYIRGATGYVDARTGAPVAAPMAVNLRRVVVNDSVRGAMLAASGLAITFGVMGVINMAHGEMVRSGSQRSRSWRRGRICRRAACSPIRPLSCSA